MNLKELWKDDNSEKKLNQLIEDSNEILKFQEGKNINDKDYFTYTYREKDYNYDADSSSVAWKYYERMYKGVVVGHEKVSIKSSRVLGEFEYYNDGSIKQISQLDYLVDNKITLAGDCVFNFIGEKSQIYSEIIKGNPGLQRKLNLCQAMHHSPYNFALVPRTGGMNNRKNNCAKGWKQLDRVDWLLYAVDQFCRKEKTNIDISKIYEHYSNIRELKKLIWGMQETNQIITSYNFNINDIILYDFLLKIGSVKHYAKTFYHLEDNDEYNGKTMLEAMIESGQKDINTVADVEKFMDLAIAYWKIQQEKYKKRVIDTFKRESQPCQNTE